MNDGIHNQRAAARRPRRPAGSTAGVTLLALVALAGPGACGAGSAGDGDAGAIAGPEPLLLAAGEGPAAAASGDLDGDGHPDLVVADQSRGELVVFRGDGLGGLERLGAFPAGPNPVDVAVADLDEDGNADLAVANHEEHFVTILLGAGDGTFRPADDSPLPIPARPHPHAIVAADLDRDGHVDLLVDDRDAEAMLVLPGRGDGTFGAPVRIPVGGDPYRGLALGDLNGDGRLDLVTPNPREVAVRLAADDGDGNRFAFRPAPPVPAPTPFAVGLGDLDGDGRLDLVAAPERPARARLYLGDGGGGFEEHPDSPFAAGRGGKKVAIGDFDGDGVDDAAVSSWFSRDVLVLFGSERGAGDTIRTATVHGGVHPWALAAVDLDGDGRDELVVGDQEGGRSGFTPDDLAGVNDDRLALRADPRPEERPPPRPPQSGPSARLRRDGDPGPRPRFGRDDRRIRPDPRHALPAAPLPGLRPAGVGLPPGGAPRRRDPADALVIPEFDALRETVGGTGPFESLASFSRASFNLSDRRDGGEPVHLAGEAVSGAYFEVLGVEPAVGRTFADDDDRSPGSSPVALLGHDLWQRQFGADSGVFGATVRLNGTPLTVVGVLPAGFAGLTGQAELWIPQAMAPAVLYPEQLTSHQHFNTVVARLRPGRSLEQAAAALERFAPVLASGWGAEHGPGRWGAVTAPLDRDRVDPGERRARLILFGAALFVLLIAGANFAGLLLGRGLSRRRELAIRRALGSSRGRLVRQLVTESVLLAAAGGALGLLLALWLTGVAGIFLPERLAVPANDYAQLAAFADLAVDGWVLAFAAVLSVAAGLVFGLGPALLATRPAAERMLHAGSGRDDPGRREGSLASPFALLVIGEVALALSLLVGAALLLETLGHLSARPGAERPEEVLTFRIEPSLTQYSSEDGPELLEAILDRVSAVPGVRSATVGPCAPGATGCATREVRLPGMEEDAEPYFVRRHYVGPEHFETLGISMLRGRSLAPSDRPGRPPVTVINRRAAETLWPGQDPIGRRIVFGPGEFLGGDTEAQVVGVVEDVPYGAPGEPIGLDLYTSYLQFSRQFTTVMVRSAGAPPEALLPDLRRAVAAVDPDLPLHDAATLAERSGRVLAGPRFRGGLLALFAALALVLATIGIYGVMSQLVARRTREMGVRIALGARPGQVVRFVLGKGLAMALAGVALGALGASALTGVLSSQLFGVEATDPLVFAAAAATLLAAGAVAMLLPARRATRVDPMRVLRVE